MADVDEVFADLDRQFRELQSAHQVVIGERDSLRAENASCVAQRDAARAETAALRTRLEESSSREHKTQLELSNARAETAAFASSADVKQAEIDRLSAELSARTERLTGAVDREGRTFGDLSRAQAEVRPLQLTVARLEEEKALLERQRGELDKEVQRLSESMVDLRRSAAAEKVRAVDGFRC